MTGKDYIRIAEAIGDARAAEIEALAERPAEALAWTQHGITVVADRIADALKIENPAFDKGRFLAACKL